MERFLERHASGVIGVLTGFDRVLFRGTLRSLSYVTGIDAFLGSQRVLCKDFGAFAQRLSDEVKAQAEAIAKQHQRPLRYLESVNQSKEDIARHHGQGQHWRRLGMRADLRRTLPQLFSAQGRRVQAAAIGRRPTQVPACVLLHRGSGIRPE